MHEIISIIDLDNVRKTLDSDYKICYVKNGHILHKKSLIPVMEFNVINTKSEVTDKIYVSIQ